jgi:multidrug resistance efflux pump
VLDKLLYYRQGKITIMISHRPKVIQRADWIVLLEEGRLKIQGTPEELRHLPGEHLDFLDDIVPATNGLVVKSSGSHSNGRVPQSAITTIMLSNSNSDYLPPIQDSDFLPPLGRWTTLSGMVMLAFVGIAIALASVTKYKVTVKAEANIRPAGELRLVQAAAEGPVMRVWVKENQVVKKGDVIATIDDSRLQTKKSQLQSNIQQSQLQLVQINAQISALNRQILAETDRITRVVAAAKAELSHRSRDYQDKQVTTVTEVEEAEANVRIAQEELQKGFAELKSAQANLSATQAALGAARSKQNRYQNVAKEGALPKINWRKHN